MDKKQKINCTVESCQFNENNEHKCSLNAINVEPIDDCETCGPDESMCGSYEYNGEPEDVNNQQ